MCRGGRGGPVTVIVAGSLRLPAEKEVSGLDPCGANQERGVKKCCLGSSALTAPFWDNAEIEPTYQINQIVGTAKPHSRMACRPASTHRHRAFSAVASRYPALPLYPR